MEELILESVSAAEDLNEVESSSAAETGINEEETELSTEVVDLGAMSDSELLEYLREYYGEDFNVTNLLAVQESEESITENQIDFDTSDISAKLDIIILLVFFGFAFAWLRSIIR